MTQSQVSTLDCFVAALLSAERECAAAGRPVTVTWLNHYSAGIALEQASEAIAELDVCGIDGQLLKWLLRHGPRTSADLVVPALLRADPGVRTVLAIGGEEDRSAALSAVFTEVAGHPVTLHTMDGFEGLRREDELREVVASLAPDLLLVGLGAGLQEQVLVEGAAAMNRGYALTCGGFLDQVLLDNYYPSWAYPLHLNWLVRVAREPRRLWRRYTVHALRAVAARQRFRKAASGVPGVSAHLRMCTEPPQTAVPAAGMTVQTAADGVLDALSSLSATAEAQTR